MKDNEELKPCPRGHSQAKIVLAPFGKYSAHCGASDCPWSLTEDYKTPEDAAAAWNLRQKLTVEEIKEIMTDKIYKLGHDDFLSIRLQDEIAQAIFDAEAKR